jgi:hypothetical protein
MFAVVCVDTPLTLATTPASPLPMLDGTCTLIWTRPAPTTPAKSTAAGCPPIITVTAFASLLAPENTCPAGTAGLAGSFGGNRLLEPFCRGKIDANTQHVRETVFNGDHVQKRQAPSGSELG